MPSTYSSLKIQLMATGENNTTWGDVTNVNLGTAIEEAIVGSADVAFSNANVTLTLTDTNSTQSARNMRLNLTGTATSGYNLIVPAIEKPYIINNGTDGTITVKNSTGTGIAVPAGRTMWVYNNGTNVVDAVNYLSSLTLGSALSVASGGTGTNTLTSGYLLKGNGTSAVSASIVYDSGALVGVGAGTGAKTRLQVTAAGFLNAPALGSATGAPFYFTNADAAYGLVSGVATDGRTWFQSQRTDGTASAGNLTLNEAGGNVGIGTNSVSYKLEVGGDVRIAGGGGDLRIQSATGTTTSGGDSQIYNDANNLIFTTGTTTTERMRITSTGDVTIAGGTLTVGGSNVAIGLQTTGQQVISSSTALGTSNLGSNILVVTGGVTLTLPTSAASGKAITISNISGSDITLSYTGSSGTDGPTTMAAQTSVMLVSDGGSPPYWRAFFASGGFDGSKLFDTGFKTLPQNQQTGTYTIALSDIGKHIYATAGSFTITIPANATTAFPIGTALTIITEDAGKTLAPAGGVTLVLAGTGGATTGSRTLAIGSVATLIKVGTNRWFVSGAGVT